MFAESEKQTNPEIHSSPPCVMAKWCEGQIDPQLPPFRLLGPHHRYTKEIPEPAPFLSWHDAEIWGLPVFPQLQ